MLTTVAQAVILRELAAVRRSIEAYPDDKSVWALPTGLPNAAGTLALHLAGNLQHYVGKVLGGSSYVRDRPAEFARRDVPRRELLAELDAASAAVTRSLPMVSPHALTQAYPETIGGEVLSTETFLVHLAAHLAYHLGQIDYHRRVVTGNAQGVGALSPAALAPKSRD